MLNRSLFKVEKNYIRQAKRGMWAEALFALGKPMHKVKLTRARGTQPQANGNLHTAQHSKLNH